MGKIRLAAILKLAVVLTALTAVSSASTVWLYQPKVAKCLGR